MDWGAFYAKCWDILVEHAGAPGDSSSRQCFVAHCLKEDHPLVEYRFGGTLGFGGKFWRNDGRIYVTCYPEDETPKRRDILDRTNEALEGITSEEGIHGPPREHERIVALRREMGS